MPTEGTAGELRLINRVELNRRSVLAVGGGGQGKCKFQRTLCTPAVAGKRRIQGRLATAEASWHRGTPSIQHPGAPRGCLRMRLGGAQDERHRTAVSAALWSCLRFRVAAPIMAVPCSRFGPTTARPHASPEPAAPSTFTGVATVNHRPLAQCAQRPPRPLRCSG
jgi:hypothetical protein